MLSTTSKGRATGASTRTLIGRPTCTGGAFSYLEAFQCRAHVAFVGHRVDVGGSEYRDELAFDAYGIVQIEGERAKHHVQLAGQGVPRSPFSGDFYFGTGRPTYEQICTSGQLPGHFAIAAVVKPPRRRQRHQPLSRAYRACKDLAAWLELNDEDIAKIVGVARTTLYSWKRGAEPRKRSAARKLYQLHGTVRALRNRLGAERLRSWLNEGSPRPITLLEQRKHEDFERLADAVIFPRDGTPRRRLDAASPPESGAAPAATANTPKRASTVRSRRLAR